ncbi:hypothetical protein [Maritimibacter sp. UBA3975]|uniref:hypothetical protein n=1 Tax=Maritimibacter sp. UBA3975 TaxID=1946833 RepID=UPI0025BEEE96|nr:hypothetical protein [Maritimibacter sp. UBA3975]
MNRTCRIVINLFAIAYLVALVLLAIGTFGLLGQEEDPLSGVFLLPLGLPWNLMIDPGDGRALVWVAILAPLVNVAILIVLCRFIGKRRAS